MPQEIIGTKNGQDFFVGSNDAPPKTTDTTTTDKTGGASSTAPDQIVSSMIMPMYENFLKGLKSSQDALNVVNQTGTANVNATEQASIAAIRQQVAQQNLAFDAQSQEIAQQGENTTGALEAQQAAASGNTMANTAFFDQKANIQNKFSKALAQVSQAKSLLAITGTAAETAAHQKAASDLLTNAHNLVNDTMALAGAGLQAATQTAQIQYQAQQYGLQVDQYLLGKQQYQDSLNATAKQFAIDAGIEKPLYSLGGMVYSSTTGQPATKEELLKFSNDIQEIKPGSLQERQFVMNLANTYGDAGITPDDNIQSAKQKLLNSKLYGVATTRSSGNNGYIGTFSQQPIADKDGKWIGTRLFNSTTGQTTYTNKDGQPIKSDTLPEGFTISTTSSFNNDAFDINWGNTSQ